MGRFQRMHMVHHATHNRNFFFVSGVVWDYVLGTAITEEGELERAVGTVQS